MTIAGPPAGPAAPVAAPPVPAPSAAGPPPPGGPVRALVPVPAPPGAPGALRRLAKVRTVPGRIRLLAGLAAACVLMVFGTVSLAVGHARDGLEVIGHTAGPQVVATADLYFALSDMDAQVADLLLTGKQGGLGPGRQAMLDRYDERRSQADRAVLQAADLAGDDATEQTTVRAVLDGLGRYERLAARALVLDERAAHDAGPPSQEVLEVYRQATDLMRLDLLPKAYNLTLDSGTIVRHAYISELSATRAGRIFVAVTGVLAVAVLVMLQIFLSRRFRRVFNVPLLLATAVVGALTVAALVVLQYEGNALTEAKDDGFNSVLALSRARAIGNTMNGDEARYLLDPQRADTYEQVYLDKSQAVLYVPGGNLDKYYTALDGAVAGFPASARFLGLYGTEASHVTLAGQREAIAKALKLYQAFQQNDREIRRLATGGSGQVAVRQAMGSAFGEYDEALVQLIALHRKAFDSAVAEGDGALTGWNIAPATVAIVALLLLLIGVRPRLAEYR